MRSLLQEIESSLSDFVTGREREGAEPIVYVSRGFSVFTPLPLEDGGTEPELSPARLIAPGVELRIIFLNDSPELIAYSRKVGSDQRRLLSIARTNLARSIVECLRPTWVHADNAEQVGVVTVPEHDLFALWLQGSATLRIAYWPWRGGLFRALEELSFPTLFSRLRSTAPALGMVAKGNP